MIRSKIGLLVILALFAGCGGVPIDGSYVHHPVFLEIVPDRGPSLGGTSVTLRGLAFCREPQVTFGDVPALATTFLSAEVILAKTPPRPMGTVAVAVSCAGEVLPSAVRFTYHASDIAFQTAVEYPAPARVDLLSNSRNFQDVDGDGRDDFIFLHFFDRTLSIFLNRGPGGFDDEPFLNVAFDAEEGAEWVPFKLGFFTGGERRELAVFTRGITNHELKGRLYSLPDATELAYFEYASGGTTDKLLGVVDLNADGFYDLLLVTEDGIEIMNGTGPLAFAPPRHLMDVQFIKPSDGSLDYALGSDSLSERKGLAPLDVNADGIEDFILAVEKLGTASDYQIKWIGIMGDPDGAYQMQTFTTEMGYLFFYDEDPIPDRYVIGPPEGLYRPVRVWRGIDLGLFEEEPLTFQVPCGSNLPVCENWGQYWNSPVWFFPHRFDVDEDGQPEFLQGTKDVWQEWIELGPASQAWTGAYVEGIADLDGDGRMELATGSRFLYCLPNGNDRPAKLTSLTPVLGGEAYFWSQPADYTGDGYLDLIGHRPNEETGMFDARLFAGRGDGSFEPMGETFAIPPPVRFYSFYHRLPSGHFDADDRLDFFVQEHAYINRGDGRFEAVPLCATDDFLPGDVAARMDLDCDGIDDLVLRGQGVSDPGLRSYRVMYGTENGAFRTAAAFDTTETAMYKEEVADINLDGLIDLARFGEDGWSDRQPSVEIQLGQSIDIDGVQTFQTGQILSGPDFPGWQARGKGYIRVDDLDGDSDLDLIVTPSPANTMYVFQNRAGWFELSARIDNFDSDLNGARTGDLNGDGTKEIVTIDLILEAPAGDLAYQLSRVIHLPEDALVPSAFTLKEFADFNGDGLAEMLVYGRIRGLAYLLLNRSR